MLEPFHISINLKGGDNLYEIYLGELKLPLLPENLKESRQKNNKKYDILALGQVIKPGRAQLRTWNIKSTFYHEDIDVTKARDYLNSLLDVDKKGVKPIRFIVNRYNQDGSLTFDTNTLVLIDNLDFEDKAGEVGDLNYEIKLSEYKDFGGKKL